MVTSVAPDLLHEHAARLLQRVDVRVVAVAAIGQRLQRAVLQVAAADAEHRQEDAALALRARSAASGRPRLVTPTLKSPSVASTTRLTPPRDEPFAGRLIRQLDAARRRWSIRRPRAARSPRGCADADRQASSGKDQLGAPGIDDQGDAVAGRQLVDEHPQGRAYERQPVARHHRSGDVDEEDEIARRRAQRWARCDRARRCAATGAPRSRGTR